MTTYNVQLKSIDEVTATSAKGKEYTITEVIYVGDDNKDHKLRTFNKELFSGLKGGENVSFTFEKNKSNYDEIVSVGEVGAPITASTKSVSKAPVDKSVEIEAMNALNVASTILGSGTDVNALFETAGDILSRKGELVAYAHKCRS